MPLCKLTAAEWLNAGSSKYTASWKPLTVSNYSKQIKKQLIPRLGAAKLEDLDTHTIQLFYNLLARSGLTPKDVRIHDLRHSFAVTSLYTGDDIKTVQANLGHATAQFTLDVYGHVTQKMRQESAMRMQAFYNHLES